MATPGPTPLRAAAVLLLVALACSAAAAPDRPIATWPSAFVADVKVSGNDGLVRPESRGYRLYVDQNATALRVDYVSGRSPWEPTRVLLLRHPAGSHNPSGLAFFTFSGNDDSCKYSRSGFFPRIVEDFRPGRRFSSDDASTALWFPTHMVPSPPEFRNLQHFETTRQSTVPPHVAPRDNTFGSINFCRDGWNRHEPHTIGGCDAMRVGMWMPDHPPSVMSIERVHARARSSYDNDWAYNASFNTQTGSPPDCAFAIPVDWRTRCLDGDQGVEVAPSGGRVTTPTGDDFVRVRLARPPIDELGEVKVVFSHGGHLRTEPRAIVFNSANWAVAQQVALKYVRDGEGYVTVRGTGGGMDGVQERTFYVYSCVGRPGYGCDRHLLEHGDKFDPAIHLLQQ